MLGLLAYILIYPFLWLISILPFRLLYALSDFIFFLIYRIFKYRKKVVKANLRLVFPEKSQIEIKKITNAFYRHLCDMMLESIKSISMSEAEIRKRYVFPNIEVIHELGKEKKNIILMGAHYGNWEWMIILQKQVNYKGYGIYKRMKNKYFDALIRRIRAKYNITLITTKETRQTLKESKKRGELTLNGMLSDQSPKLSKTHYWTDFMGIKVPAYTGAEMLAKQLDMTVIFFTTKKLKRGYYETTFKKVTSTPNDYKDYEITDLFLRFTEEQIHKAPQYYFWTHKRWKHKDKVPVEFQ